MIYSFVNYDAGKLTLLYSLTPICSFWIHINCFSSRVIDTPFISTKPTMESRFSPVELATNGQWTTSDLANISDNFSVQFFPTPSREIFASYFLYIALVL